MRVPLARDFVRGKKMLHGTRQVTYVGRTTTGAFLFERGFHDFISLWPFQLRTRDEPVEHKFDEKVWQAAKDEADLERTSAAIAKINKVTKILSAECMWRVGDPTWDSEGNITPGKQLTSKEMQFYDENKIPYRKKPMMTPREMLDFMSKELDA